jgi:hypothetical protein
MAGRLVDFVDGADVRVVQRRRRLCFLAEARVGFGIAGQARREELQRDGAIQAEVDRLEQTTPMPPPPSSSTIR